MTVEAGPAVKVTVSPAQVEVASGATQQFTAKVEDKHGNPLTGAQVGWTADPKAGTIDLRGLFTAGNTGGTYKDAIKATVGG